MESVSASPKKHLYVVLAYPVKDSDGPAKIWGSSKPASNVLKEGWIDIGAQTTGSVSVKSMLMSEAHAVRESAGKYSARGDYRYLIIPVREWEGVL